MPLSSIDDYEKRIGDGFYTVEPWVIEFQAAITTLSSSITTWAKVRPHYVVPSLPSGVTGYIPVGIHSGTGSGQKLFVCKLIDLGSLDLAGPTFTDGAAYPTEDVLGVNRQLSGPVLLEVETVLNATPGNFTITYVDQDGNAAETTGALAFTASATVGSCGLARLNTPDWGVRDLTGATRTAGTTPSGIVRFWGLIPLGTFAPGQIISANTWLMNSLLESFSHISLVAGDKIGFFAANYVAVNSGHYGWITFVGDD